MKNLECGLNFSSSDSKNKDNCFITFALLEILSY